MPSVTWTFSSPSRNVMVCNPALSESVATVLTSVSTPASKVPDPSSRYMDKLATLAFASALLSGSPSVSSNSNSMVVNSMSLSSGRPLCLAAISKMSSEPPSSSPAGDVSVVGNPNWPPPFSYHTTSSAFAIVAKTSKSPSPSMSAAPVHVVPSRPSSTVLFAQSVATPSRFSHQAISSRCLSTARMSLSPSPSRSVAQTAQGSSKPVATRC